MCFHVNVNILAVCPSSLKVNRRQSYKGKITGLRSGLPLDACTLPAICCIITVMLSGKGIARTLIHSAQELLNQLNSACKVNGVIKLLKDESDCWIDVEDGTMSKLQLRTVVDNMGIAFSRLFVGSKWFVLTVLFAFSVCKQK